LISSEVGQHLRKTAHPLELKVMKLWPRLAWNQNWQINFKFTTVVFFIAFIPTLLSQSRMVKSEHIYLISAIEKILLWVTFLAIVSTFNFALSKRRIKRTNLFEVVALGFGAGFITGVLDVIYQKDLGLIQTEYFSTSKIFSFAVTGALWIPIGTALMEGPLIVRAKKEIVLHELEGARRGQIRRTNQLVEIQQQINSGFQLRLQSTVMELKKQTPQLDIFEKQADMTQYLNREIAIWNLTAIQTMRDLSHDFITVKKRVSFKWIESLRRIFLRIFAIIDSFSISIKSAPTSPYLFTAMVGSVVAFPILRGQVFEVGLIKFMNAIILIFTIQLFAYIVRKKFKPQWWPLEIIALFCTIALPWVIPFFSELENSKHGQNNKNIIFDCAILLIFIAIHVAQSYVISGEEIIKVLDGQNIDNAIREKLINEQISILSRSWAELVHGRLVTQLTSASILLDREGPKGDADSTITALEIISEALHDSNSNIPKHQRVKTLSDEVNFRVQPWTGIVDVRVHYGPGCKSKKSKRHAEIGVLLEEVISNSVRHGDASGIEIFFRIQNLSELLISVVHDSRKPIPAEVFNGDSKSLGFLIFESIADGNWKLEHDSQAEKTFFQAKISLM